jgi:hypothetical protein
MDYIAVVYWMWEVKNGLKAVVATKNPRIEVELPYFSAYATKRCIIYHAMILI